MLPESILKTEKMTFHMYHQREGSKGANDICSHCNHNINRISQTIFDDN